MCKQIVVEVPFICCIKALNHTFACKGMCSGTNEQSAWSLCASDISFTCVRFLVCNFKEHSEDYVGNQPA